MQHLHTVSIVGSSPTIATIYERITKTAESFCIAGVSKERRRKGDVFLLLRWQKSYARVCKTLLCWCESSPQLHFGTMAQLVSAQS